MSELQPEHGIRRQLQISVRAPGSLQKQQPTVGGTINLLKCNNQYTAIKKIRKKKRYSGKLTYFGCVEDYIPAVWKDADGPRRQIVVHVIEHNSCSRLCVIV